jgi:hypothetical protein
MDFLRNVQLISEARGQPYFAAAFRNSRTGSSSLVIVAIISVCESAMHRGWRRASVQLVFLASGTWPMPIGSERRHCSPSVRALGMEPGPAHLMYVVWFGWAILTLLIVLLGARKGEGRPPRWELGACPRAHASALLESASRSSRRRSSRVSSSTLSPLQQLYSSTLHARIECSTT